MSDGTIEEDFEEALAREIEAGTGGGSLTSPGKLNKSFLFLIFFGVPHLAIPLSFFIEYVVASSIAYIHPV
jgi:hypothetical protein